jgi:hypothetical protein
MRVLEQLYLTFNYWMECNFRAIAPLKKAPYFPRYAWKYRGLRRDIKKERSLIYNLASEYLANELQDA